MIDGVADAEGFAVSAYVGVRRGQRVAHRDDRESVSLAPSQRLACTWRERELRGKWSGERRTQPLDVLGTKLDPVFVEPRREPTRRLLPMRIVRGRSADVRVVHVVEPPLATERRLEPGHDRSAPWVGDR